MTRICWRLVDVVSRLLEPDERDAVRGDFAESGVTGGKALFDLIGLATRRQAARWKDWRPWLALLGIASLYLILIWAPEERTRGGVQRIFYFHVPSAYTAFVAFCIGGIASVRYLIRRDFRYDDLSVAANEVGLVFAIANLVTGMLWAKAMWGTYWVWDARLTTMLLLALIYAGYLILRRGINEPGRRAAVCAGVSIVGIVDIPIVYMANRWWHTQHPSPIIFGGQGSGLDPRMTFVVLFTFMSLLFLSLYWIRTRRRLVQIRREVDSLQAAGSPL